MFDRDPQEAGLTVLQAPPGPHLAARAALLQGQRLQCCVDLTPTPYTPAETLYHRDDALSVKPVLHYQGTAYLCY